ncbi:MAG: glutathione S-transferase family protein [Pseudomonadota bacterium]
MSKPYRHYAWQMSYYSGKTRAYLRYKGIPHVEQVIRFWHMALIQKKVGAQVMPVVVTPQGEWLQDTSHIIDVLEQRHPAAPVVPTTPRQKMAAYLIEAWGDEFWVHSAMHYRWNFSENYTQLFRHEGGDNLLPFAPRFIKNQLIDRIAVMLRGFLQGLGVVPGQLAAVEQWTHSMLDALDAHFALHDYLLGSKPSLGDLGLIGPLYAHLGRDPHPARELIAKRPHVAAWVKRMQHPAQPQGGAFLADDALPETLTPLFHSIFGEFWPQLLATLDAAQKTIPTLAPGKGLPRQLGLIDITLAGQPYQLRARPYCLWMAQRLLDVLHALPSEEQQAVQAWVSTLGYDSAMQLQIKPRLKRTALFVAAE